MTIVLTPKSNRVYTTQYYDPRVWVREGEKTLSERVKEACKDLGNVGAFLFSHIISIIFSSLFYRM